MPITKLQFKPGVNKNDTSYSGEGGWFSADKVRFVDRFAESIGGWIRQGTTSFLGISRSIFPWVTLSSTRLISVGTTSKYYINEGGVLQDITPIRSTTAAGDVTFAATTSSSLLTVSDTAHGAVKGDFVTYSGAVSLGGLITAGVLNQEYEIDSIVNTNSYQITARTAATTIESITVDGQIVDTPVLANASDTGNGGASIVGAYQINRGLDTVVIGTGWGSGVWSRGGWGTAVVQTDTTSLRLWSQDNYGEDLVFNVYGAGIYFWNTGTDVLGTDRGTALSDLVGVDAYAPTISKWVVVTKDRHVVVFGCDAETAIGTQDPLLIRFCNQENILVWATTVDNSAGDLRVTSGSYIVTAVETRRQILVFTDKSLSAMQYIGPPYTFGIDVVSENTSIISPNAAVAVDDAVFWMGVGGFHSYTGQASEVESTVDQYVYDNLNLDQAEKIVAGVNIEFTEVWWFYPSVGSDEVDSYVIYNYKSGVWSVGDLARTAWANSGVGTKPVAAGTDGYLYVHESGDLDGSVNPPAAMSSSLESNPVDIGDGDTFMFVDRLIPDLTFAGSSSDVPAVVMTLQARNYPGAAYAQTDASDVTQSASTPVELFTTEKQVRLRGRSVSLKVSSSTIGTKWRLGTPRINVRQDGKR
jgi:hypothetical protein